MSNLKAQIKAIQQKLVVSTPKTVTALKAIRLDLKTEIERLEGKIDDVFERMENSLVAQAG